MAKGKAKHFCTRHLLAIGLYLRRTLVRLDCKWSFTEAKVAFGEGSSSEMVVYDGTSTQRYKGLAEYLRQNGL